MKTVHSPISLILCGLLGTPAASLSTSSERSASVNKQSDSASSRRRFVHRAAAAAAAPFILSPLAAQALQDKNEALCNTGFFTNIWQYKCTDIGDIEDEGLAKGLTTSEESATDSLMGKLVETKETSHSDTIRESDQTAGTDGVSGTVPR